MERKMISEIKEGEHALLKGWVHEIRDLSKMKFILLRDTSGIVQCIIKDEKLMKETANLSIESVVEIEGAVNKANVKAELSRKDVEVHIKTIKILSKAETLPIQVNEKTITTELGNRLDNRFLDVRKPKIAAIFKIQSEICNSFKEFFYNKGFIEIQTPAIIGAASEGGTDLFEVKYFEKKAYLAQSPQLYKQMLACSMEKTCMICPVWRAEKHNTVRHINEIRQMDIEMAFADQMTVMKQQEEVVKYMIEQVVKHNKADLDLLGVKLKVPDAKYIHYDDTIKLLQKHGLKIEIGDDLNPEAENKLGELYPDTILFVHSWPANCKPFYIMPKDGKENAECSEGFDAIYKGLEISSGGQRIHLPDLLIARIKKKGLKPEHFKDYIDSFRFGAPPHGGWSIGLERMTLLICGLDNIREATMFPRDRDRLTP